MGHIKEPDGVDLIIGPSKRTEEDKKVISEIIRYYKRTGKIPTKKQLAAFNDSGTLDAIRKKRIARHRKISTSK
jgi:hypothetical protein